VAVVAWVLGFALIRVGGWLIEEIAQRREGRAIAAGKS
jgi:hypothetical protein